MQVIEWFKGKVRILDQTRLPQAEVYLELSTYREVAQAIKEMKVRGAPVVGITAAYGMALGAQTIKASSKTDFLIELRRIAEVLISTRPTAVNLLQAINRMQVVTESQGTISKIKAALIEEAKAIHTHEEWATSQISRYGAELIGDGFTILTHCNAGFLATSGNHGTALGVIRAAREQGKNIRVFVTETRPLLQGARLTAWELLHDGIPVTLITDSMAGHFMSKKEIHCVIVGADRIAANGDAANKIGTYTLAVLAKENGIPFYVAAPTTSIDLSLRSGDQIPIEFRNSEEITRLQGVQIAPEGIETRNPAFDVTPHRYVSAIITEMGIVRKPYRAGLKQVCCVLPNRA
ncbi:MAG: S-methyl-5-thioribose-1-phosphate isomerase [Chloroflexi bacterium]|nr:S-methyl-5-thioribose-1-phosphate isomerase [Chloroflexota bacterium]